MPTLDSMGLVIGPSRYFLVYEYDQEKAKALLHQNELVSSRDEIYFEQEISENHFFEQGMKPGDVRQLENPLPP